MYFVLDERGEPQRERDLEAWSKWFEQADRNIARTAVATNITVLTTFSGVDESAEQEENSRPFDSRVFGGVLDGQEMRSRSRSAAIAAHDELVQWCRMATTFNFGITEEQIT
jgi:hypothetical protein